MTLLSRLGFGVWARRPTEEVLFRLCAVASLAFSTWIVLHEAGRTASLVEVHSDHFHHSRAALTFIHRGFEVYRRPFRETAVPFPYGGLSWPDWPIAYPPGMFLVFLPPALMDAWVPMTSAVWAKLTVLWIVVLCHLALFGIWSAISRVRGGGAAPVLLGIWILMLRMSLCGFYDPVWLGCGAVSIAALIDRRFVASLLWFSAAILISYRAASLAPAAGWAAVLLLRGGEPIRTKVVALLATAIACALVLWTFWLCRNAMPPLSTIADKSTLTPLLPFGPRSAIVLLMCVATASLALVKGDALVAISVGWAFVLTLVHAGPSWHGSMLVPTLLLVGVGRRSASLVFVRNIVAVWFLVMEEFAFNNTMAQLIELLLKANLR